MRRVMSTGSLLLVLTAAAWGGAGCIVFVGDDDMTENPFPCGGQIDASPGVDTGNQFPEFDAGIDASPGVDTGNQFPEFDAGVDPDYVDASLGNNGKPGPAS